jgi:hypothetical protein
MSLRRPFVAPRSTKSTANKTMLEDSNGEMVSPKNIGNSNAVEGYDQTPISEWRVSDDEEDSIPISQLIVADKDKVRGHRKDNSEWGKRMEKEVGRIERRQQTTAETSSPHIIPFIAGILVLSYREAIEVGVNGEVMTWSDEERIPILFQRGHDNLGRGVAKHFQAVLHCGVVTEIIPRRRGFLYKITYEDGDQEDMDEDELIFAIQLRAKKDIGGDVQEDVQDEAEVLSEEGSVYDSEEDRKALTG